MSGSAGVSGVPDYTPAVAWAVAWQPIGWIEQPKPAVLCYCGKVAVVSTGWDVSTGCETNQTVDYCDEHWQARTRKLDSESRYRCGCVLLEVIDLTRADPGREYADMLRAL